MNGQKFFGRVLKRFDYLLLPTPESLGPPSTGWDAPCRDPTKWARRGRIDSSEFSISFGSVNTICPELRAFFTLRRAHWPFQQINTPYAWHWEATYPQAYGYTDDPEKPEQVNVSVAQNLRQADGVVTFMSNGDARGRSFHDGRLDRTPGAVNHGHNFAEQWNRALKLDPPFVMITGWNEWIASRFGKEGESIAFVDQFDQEFSRDIEPMKGGHGDHYYWQMVSGIRRFKGTGPLPVATGPKTIRMEAGFDPTVEKTREETGRLLGQMLPVKPGRVPPVPS